MISRMNWSKIGLAVGFALAFAIQALLRQDKSIAKGAVEDMIPPQKQSNYVDGISGATLTGRYLTAGLREVLEDYEAVSIRFRKNQIAKPPE